MFERRFCENKNMIHHPFGTTMKYPVCALLCLSIVSACSTEFERYPERIIRQEKRSIPVANLFATAETTPVSSTGDAADDPAIWWNERDPSRSLVLGTNKQQGLLVYTLDGELTQSLEAGRVNNVDLRQAATFENEHTHSIAVASNRSANTLSIFTVDHDGTLTLVGNHPLSLPEPYGACLYQNSSQQTFVLVNDKNGQYQQWLLESLSPLKLSLVRSFLLASQPEGCAAHDNTGTLFFGEEEYGVWKLDLDQQNSQAQLLATVNDGVLVADVEGMDIYRGKTTDYLVVSSQGDNSYAVYDIGLDAAKFDYQGSFRVVLDEQANIDGSQETDGITISSQAFGPNYPLGFIAIQDGFNRAPKQAQNFKYLDWRKVKRALSLQD